MAWLPVVEQARHGRRPALRRLSRLEALVLYPRYFFDDPLVAADMSRRFDQVRTPIIAANAVDDLWASPASRDAFMAGYRNAPVQRVDLDPRQHGLKAIGHMGYFRREARPLWDEVLAWFSQLPTASTT